VDFWNRRCAGCVEVMPKYQRLCNQFHKYGFEIYSVCVFGMDRMTGEPEGQPVLFQGKIQMVRDVLKNSKQE